MVAIDVETRKVLGCACGRDIMTINNPFLDESRNKNSRIQKMQEINYILLKPLVDTVTEPGILTVGIFFSVLPERIDENIGQMC